MAGKAEAYIDTSAFIATLDRSDSHHPVYARLFAEPPLLVTSGLVVAEGHAWFLRRYDRQKAAHFLSFIQELVPLTVLSFGSEDLSVIAPFLRKFSDQDLTLADLHGLAIMSKHRIRACWSTDRHLGLTGVRLVNSETY